MNDIQNQQGPSDAAARGATSSPGRLIVSDVRKEYATPGEPLVVLKGVSFELSPGDDLAIVGPSGSGKSTLLNIIGTLDSPTGGSIELAGVNPFSLKPKLLARFRSERIGFVFQEHHLLPQCTALENVLVARLALGKVTADDSARAAELLKRVGLEGRASHVPAELSGGERQRVAIARALINRPALLLCDEPTGNLDSKNAQTIADLLHEVAGQLNATLIAVTHSAPFAESFKRTVRMLDGELRGD